MLDKIIYQFLNCSVVVCERMSIYIPRCVMDMITYPCWDEIQSNSVKGDIQQMYTLHHHQRQYTRKRTHA